MIKPVFQIKIIIPYLVSMMICFGTFSEGYSQTSQLNNRLEEVTLQLRWKHQFQFAGYYAAIEQGYYKSAGFKVNIVEGGIQLNTIDEVTSNRAQYGVSNSEILLHRLNGKPLIVLAAIFQHSPLVMLTREETGLNNPQALIGKRVIIDKSTRDIELKAMFLNEGISLNYLQIVENPYNPKQYFDKTIQGYSAYITNQAFFYEEAGIPYSIIYPRTYGIDFYGDCLFTSETEVNSHPERVKAFRKASLKGWKYAFNHTDEMVKLLLNTYKSKKTKNHLYFEAEMMQKLILPELIEMGHMNPGRWQHIAETFERFKLTTPDYDLEGFIYDPNPQPNVGKLYWFIGIAITVGFVIGAIAFFLLIFNKRLRDEINIRSSTEKALVISEKKYRDLFEKSKNPTLIIKNFEFVDCNQVVVNTLGYMHKDDILKTHPSKLSPEKQPDGQLSEVKANEMMRLALENGSHQFIWDHTRSNGEVFPVEVSLTTISNENNEHTIHTVWRDITAAKKAEEDLKESEKKFRLLVENLYQGIYLKDLEGKFTFANKVFWHRWVDSLDNLLGKTDYDIHPKEFAEQYRIDDIRVIETQKKADIDEEIELPNGERGWVQSVKVPFFDDFGKIAGTMGMVWDITEKRKMEQALATSEAQLKSFVEALPDTALIIDEGGNYLKVVSNEKTNKLLGSRFEQIAGKHISDLFPPEQTKIFQSVITKTIQSKKSQTVEYVIEMKDQEFYFEGRTSLMDGDINGKKTIVWLAHDISARKKADAVLENHQKLLKEKVELRTSELNKSLSTLKATQDELIRSERLAALGNMVAGMAHEINTPLGISVTETSFLTQIVKEMNQLYEEKKLTQSKFQDFLMLLNESTDSITRNLSRSANLIRSFKLVSVDQTVLDKRNFFFKKYIDDIILSLRPTLKKTNHIISITCDNELNINSYPGAFSQIITNLIMNSLIHAFDEKKSGEINISVKQDKNDLHLIYSDNGAGMSKEALKQVFDPFFTTKRGEGGTGLGMQVVYNLVTQKLLGRIDCESSPGKGVTINIIFPINQPN